MEKLNLDEFNQAVLKLSQAISEMSQSILELKAGVDGENNPTIEFIQNRLSCTLAYMVNLSNCVDVISKNTGAVIASLSVCTQLNSESIETINKSMHEKT
ncbi:MAG: hypothetical protein WC854_11680 [Bacteroidales bacterium]